MLIIYPAFLKKSRKIGDIMLARQIFCRYNSYIVQILDELSENRRNNMSGIMICMLVAIGVYLVGMLAIGLIYSKDQTSAGEFYLGGRRLGPIVTALSTEASDMSAWLLMGVPGLAFFTGVAEAAWTAIGLIIGTYLNWLFVAKRLCRYSIKVDAITIPDFIARRFRDNTKIIETLGALMIIVFFVPYTASGFVACGKLFHGLFGFDYVTAMIVSAAVIVAYTSTGGFMAASVTSLVQSLVMTATLIIVVIFGINAAGGWDQVVANAQAIPGYLDMFSRTTIEAASASKYAALDIASTIAWALGYFGMPHILTHFMAINDEDKLTTSRRVGTVWVVISLAVAVVIGIVGFGMAKAGAVEMFGSSSAAENLIPSIANLIAANGTAAALVAGVLLAGILAATMSTADAQLLAAASGITHNILTDVVGVKLSDKKTMVIARIAVICIAILGILFALDPKSSIFSIVSFAWAGFGATFGPIVLFSLFWKRCNKWGAIAGMFSGAAMVFIWKYGIAKLGGVFAIYELLPAFVFSGIIIVVVSLLTKEPDAEIVAEFESVK